MCGELGAHLLFILSTSAGWAPAAWTHDDASPPLVARSVDNVDLDRACPGATSSGAP
jgi:hypothetical protein